MGGSKTNKRLTGRGVVSVESALLSVDHQIDVEHLVIENVHVSVAFGDLLEILGHRVLLGNRALVAALLFHQLVVLIAEDRLLQHL